MDHLEDNAGVRSGHLFLTVYLAAIVAALLAATTTPQLLPSAPAGAVGGSIGNDALAEVARSRDASGESVDRAIEQSDNGEAGTSSAEDGRRALADTQSNSSTIGEAQSAALGLAPIDFDLGEATASGLSPAGPDGTQIEVRKPVYSQGVELGSLSVTIDQNARLFAQRSDLQALLEGDEAATRQISRIEAEGLVSFQRLREYGLSLRYDPIADRIVLQGG